MNTLKFLSHYGIYYDDICFTGDKWMIDSEFMIDDNLEFLGNKLENTQKEKRLIIDAPYNRVHSDFTRFNTLSDAANYIIEKYGKANEEENNNH